MVTSRRGFLRSSGLVGAGAGRGWRLAWRLPGVAAWRAPRRAAEVVGFFGAHQAGIATPSEGFVHFGAFDLVSDSADDLRRVLARWSGLSSLKKRAGVKWE